MLSPTSPAEKRIFTGFRAFAAAMDAMSIVALCHPVLDASP
jgi:hypothetical protein